MEITAANIPFENNQTVGDAIRDLYDTTAWVDNDVLKVGATEIATLKLANNKTVATTDQLLSIGTTATTAAAGNHAHTGYAASSHNHAAGDINSGTLAVANGGTGVNGSSITKNYVLAAPSAANGAVSFRALVAADLPSHTHSDYVSKSDTNIQTLASSVRLAGGKVLSVGYGNNDGGYIYLEGSNSSIGSAYIDIVKGGDQTYTEITPDNIAHSTDGGTNETILTYPVPAKSGTIATSVDLATKQDKITASGLLKGNGSGGITAATSGTDYAAADHTHSGYVSKTWTGENQSMKGGLQMQGNANSIAWIELYFPSSSGEDPNIAVYNGSSGNETRIFPGSIKWQPDSQTNYTQLTYPSSAKSGVIATDTMVNAAIATINTNFTGIQTMLTLKSESNISVGNRASGWSFSSDGETWDNKLKFFHWGHIAYLSGTAKCSSALTANSTTSSIGTMSIPSGYTLIGANAGIPGGDYWFWSSAAGVMGCKTFVAKSANATLAIRLIFVLHTIGNKYTKTTVANI